MRPTFSIIVFTVLSGAGYGLWFLLGLDLLVGRLACGAETFLCIDPALAASALIGGFVLVSIGLLSSVAHLGQPLRAWRALSQWRSSWLSREGVASLLTFLPAVAIAACIVLASLPAPESSGGASFDPERALRLFGGLLAMGALATVYCTANIYASLKPVAAWCSRFVTPVYLLLGLYSGALLLYALSIWPAASTEVGTQWLAGIIMLAAGCALVKVCYWRDIDRLPHIGPGRATGIDALGVVRSFEQPHTEENYLTHEMGFVLARKHAAKLRTIALASAFGVPAVFALLGIVAPASRMVLLPLTLVFGFGGVFVERWLFFAEAKHAVAAYYGR
jgi:DMSO reductase anchor subunit